MSTASSLYRIQEYTYTCIKEFLHNKKKNKNTWKFKVQKLIKQKIADLNIVKFTRSLKNNSVGLFVILQ